MRAALLLASFWAVAACGSASTEEDSSIDVPAEAEGTTETDAGPDGVPDAEGVPETLDDADAEPDGEVGSDVDDVSDGSPDGEEEVPDSTDGADAEPEDVGPPDGEAGEADGAEDGTTGAEDGGGTLEVTMSSLEAWTVIFMGSGSHVVFTLELRNTGGGDVTGFHAVSGKVTGAGGAELFTFTGPSELNVGTTGGPVFDGRVTAGGSATVVGHGFDLAVTLGTHCSEDVSLSLDVAWDGGATSVVGGPTSLMCVSK